MGRRGRYDDHVSEDYRDLLSARDVLRRQLSIAKSDHERLKEFKRMARDNPIEFVERIRKRTLPNIPVRQHVHYVPYVDFTHYAVKSFEGGPALRPSPPLRRSTSRSRGRGGSVPPPEEVKPGDVVRGRAFSASKPKTFNQLWTEEEHEKLLQLLEVYPEEAVAAHRWAKIARALGNRTPKQVASRTQKYFAKLRRMGVEPPGKAPGKKRIETGDTLFRFRKEDSPHTEQMQDINTEKQNARIVDHMETDTPTNEPEQLPKELSSTARGDSTSSADVYRPPPMSMDDEDDSITLSQINPDMQDTTTYQELQRLRGLREEELASNERPVSGPDTVIHDGFGCDKCGADPIIGVRWHCEDCVDSAEVDLCTECKEEGFVSASHPEQHTLVAYATAQESSFFDKDYARFSLEDNVETNYLDPQFMSA